MAAITGIGGIFYKVADPARTRAWYTEHLGLAADESGGMLAQRDGAMTVWSPFAASSEYFGSAEQRLMINFLVDDLDGLLASLAAKGVPCVGEPLDESYGKFGWIIDCDGNKVELWQPKS